MSPDCCTSLWCSTDAPLVRAEYTPLFRRGEVILVVAPDPSFPQSSSLSMHVFRRGAETSFIKPSAPADLESFASCAAASDVGGWQQQRSAGGTGRAVMPMPPMLTSPPLSTINAVGGDWLPTIQLYHWSWMHQRWCRGWQNL